MGVLDELFEDAEKQRLVQASNQFKTYEGLPTAAAPSSSSSPPAHSRRSPSSASPSPVRSRREGE